MSEAAPPAAAPAAAAPMAGVPPEQPRIVELKVSGHLMTLDAGVFCIFQPPGSPAAGRNGLPGMRISAAPAGREGVVRITTFREDGWLPGGEGAALVRVAQGPAQVLVTVYQAPDAPAELAPRLQVMRLGPEPTTTSGPAPGPTAGPAAAPAPARGGAATPEMVAHVQRTGDVGAQIGEWMGVRGSKLWIEGFGIAPRSGLPAPVADCLEYQAVLGRDWLSPWVDGGAFCGSRGMALPLLGLAVRLKGEAAAQLDCRVTATFVDGTLVGPVAAGQVAQAETLAPLEAFRIDLRPRGATPAHGTTPSPAAARPPAPTPAGAARRKTARRPA
jgi:hypothetical protein